jgi:hypothetical protein
MTTLPTNLNNSVSIEVIGNGINGQGLDLTIKVNNEVIEEISSLTDQRLVTFYKSYPMLIELVVNGKQLTDTQIDQDGNIIKDKHILVSKLLLAGVPVKKWLLEQYVVSCDNQNTNYLGFNGIAKIHLPKKDAFDNHLHLISLNKQIDH